SLSFQTVVCSIAFHAPFPPPCQEAGLLLVKRELLCMDRTTQQLQQELEMLRRENETLRSAAMAQRHTEEALKASERRHRTIVEPAPEAIVVLDCDTGHIIDVNSNAVNLFQLAQEALLQVGPVELSAPIQPDGRITAEVAIGYLQQALNGETPVFEWLHRNS